MLGNPFDMQRDERLRDPVCGAFSDYFDAVIAGEAPVAVATRMSRERGLPLAYAWKRPSREAFMGALAVLEERQQQGMPTTIQCFCAPSRCHLDKVKDYLDRQLEAFRSSQSMLRQEALPLKTHNPLRDLAPLNDAVALPMQKDIAMSELATQFIGRSAAPASTPSFTRNYEREWAKQGLANTGLYTAQDVVMLSGSGPWRGVTQQQIGTVFESHYKPLLERVIAAKAQVVVGTATGTDKLVQAFLQEQGYTFAAKLGSRGYLHCYPQREQERSSPTPTPPAVTPTTETGLPAPDRITRLEKHQMFVFGSNTQGRHGAGAALQAVAFGAEYGKPCGRQGQTYAIVTKDLTQAQQLRSVPLNAIELQVSEFLTHAIAHPENELLVTRFGCDLAGYTELEIGSLWVGKDIPTNVRLPQAFLDVLQAEQPVVSLSVGMLQEAVDICKGQRRGNKPLPTHIVSIGSRTEDPPEGLSQFPGRVLRLEFDELDEPALGLQTASREQVEAALAFGREARLAGGRLFVHCSAGVCRSPTLALAILADQLEDPATVQQTFQQLCPNALLIEPTVKLIDTVLGTQLQETFLTVEPGRIEPTPTMTQVKRTDIIIHSGGQTGADRGGLLGAEALGLQTGGIAPHGWLTEKGADPTLGTRFGLVEGPQGKSQAQTYVLRTKLNVQRTDGTVVFGSVDPTHDKGSALTLKLADEHDKPWIQFEVSELYDSVTAGAELRSWLEEHQIHTLNVAGNRGSKNTVLESLVQTVIEVSCRAPFQSLNVVPCGLFIEEEVDWRAETAAIQTMLQQLAKRAAASREQLCFYCPDSEQRDWLQSVAADLTQAGTVVITGEAWEWSPHQKSRLLSLFQDTASAQQALTAAAGLGVDCLAFDCQQRTYCRVQAATPQAQPQTGVRKRPHQQLEL